VPSVGRRLSIQRGLRAGQCSLGLFVGHPCFQRATDLPVGLPRPQHGLAGFGCSRPHRWRGTFREQGCSRGGRPWLRSSAASLSLAGVRSGGGIIGTRDRASSLDPRFLRLFLTIALNPGWTEA
jgi:hypothetical protein